MADNFACPFCQNQTSTVVESRQSIRDRRRRRECLKCHRRYTTYEYIEDMLPHVVKRDGRREPFDRQKLRRSITQALADPPFSVADELVAAIETELLRDDLKRAQDVETVQLRIMVEGLLAPSPAAWARYVSFRCQTPADFLRVLRRAPSRVG